VDPLTLVSIAVGGMSLILSALAQIAKTSEKTQPYAEFLERMERILTGKPVKTGTLEERLEKAVGQLTSASESVNSILGEIQGDVERKKKEAERLRSIIESLKKEYEANKSLANLTTEEANAVRQILTKEVDVLKRRSYLPDILINFGVGAFFFIIGIVVTRLFGQ
jgi:DNA anti-recombination protein RmuC